MDIEPDYLIYTLSKIAESLLQNHSSTLYGINLFIKRFKFLNAIKIVDIKIQTTRLAGRMQTMKRVYSYDKRTEMGI